MDDPLYLLMQEQITLIVLLVVGAALMVQAGVPVGAALVVPVSEQIPSPRRFCPPGHNPLAEIVHHGHNPLADIVPFPQILSPPPPPPPPSPSNRCLAVPVFLIGVRSYKPRPLFASSQKGKLSTHTLPLPLHTRSAINLPSRQTSWLRP